MWTASLATLARLVGSGLVEVGNGFSGSLLWFEEMFSGGVEHGEARSRPFFNVSVPIKS